MPGFVLRTLISALGLWIASKLVSGLHFSGPGTLLLAAFLLGIVNAVVRPLFVILTLPFTLLTLGAFLLVVNAAMLGLVAALLEGFRIDGFWSAVFGAILVSLTGWIASGWIGPRGRVEVIALRAETPRIE
jgi:putative membrane protein